MHLYEDLALRLEKAIRAGTFRAGDRIPSVRQTSLREKISATTTVQAYLALENRGLIEAPAEIRVYVRASLRERFPEPRVSRPARAVTAISVGTLQSRLFDGHRLPGLSLSAALPRRPRCFRWRS